MAKKATITSLKKKTVGKKPKITDSTKRIENWAKKEKEVDAHNKRVEAERARRKKLLKL